MHYIRFLKTPRVHVERGNVLLKAVLVITTDLGETFYPDDLELVVTLEAGEPDGDIYLRRKFQWSAGARALPISFNLSLQDVEWPACVHVSPRSPAFRSTGFLPPIADVWSGALHPTKGCMDSGTLVQRRFVSSAPRTVSLLEEAGDSIARHLWDGSQALAQHIDHTLSLETPSPLPLLEYLLISATYRRLTVLELGCGCGTVGISLAQSVPDCDVLLTDLPAVRDLAEANIARMNAAIASKVAFADLDWEADALPDKIQTRVHDVVLVSECTYNTDTLQPLVKTLVSLTTRSPKALIIVSTKTRHASEAAFFDMMRDAGLIEDGRMRVPLPGVPGSGYADTATDVGLHVFRGKHHRLSLSPRGSEMETPRIKPKNSKGSRSQ